MIEDWFILVISKAIELDGKSLVHQDLTKYFVRGKITEIISLGDI